MNYKMMGRYIAQILLVEIVFMIPALLISLFDHDRASAHGFLMGMLITAIVAVIILFICRNAKKGFYAREGLACVGIAWIAMSVLGCLPFFFSGEIPHFEDALFEMVSGFTTTGASILPEVENLSRGILYWRSFSHWLGGMGVLVLLLAIIPASGKTGFTMHLLRAESPGPNVGKLAPRIRKTASILYLLYIVLTIINFVFLLFGGMSAFDAVCTAFGTAGTGGFGIRNDSLASFSPYIQNVCTVFMLLFGINFSCYYLLLLRQIKNVFRDEELRFYLGMVVASTALIVWNLHGFYNSLGETLRHASFQVVSVMTTTGYTTTDYDLWPSFSKAVLLCLMLCGACAGSTSGGIKCSRILLLIKILLRNTKKILHPQKIQVVRNNGQKVDEKILDNVNAYLAAYAIIIVSSFLVISLDNFSFTTNFSAVIACINNVGPGFDMVGATGNFSQFGIISKLVLIMDMLAGRLEIFPILILFSRSTWKHR